MKYQQILIYFYRNSMGNTLPNQQQQLIKNALENKRGTREVSSIENTIRYSQNRNSGDRGSRIQLGKNEQKNIINRSLTTKSKQKLSLSKQHHSHSQIKLKANRSASNDFKNNTLIRNLQPSHNHHHSQVNIQQTFTRVNYADAQPKIKKVPLRPRDLPRKVSTQKIIVYQQPQIRRVPLEPRIIVIPPMSSPCIQFNYAVRKQKNKSQHSMESSIVTPFIPHNKSQNIQQQANKLKKVPLNRSYVSSSYALPQNNGQQFEGNKENEKLTVKVKGQIKSEPKIQAQGKQQLLFTDPNLYSYITNKPHPCASHIKNKYALAVGQPTINPIKVNRMTSPIKIYNRLEQAISEQVQSKAMIEGESYRFPTFTDVSQGSHTDNTSFIPMIRNNSSKNQEMHGEQLLNYCRPKIDERVFADLQRLKLNQ